MSKKPVKMTQEGCDSSEVSAKRIATAAKKDGIISKKAKLVHEIRSSSKK